MRAKVLATILVSLVCAGMMFAPVVFMGQSNVSFSKGGAWFAAGVIFYSAYDVMLWFTAFTATMQWLWKEAK